MKKISLPKHPAGCHPMRPAFKFKLCKPCYLEQRQLALKSERQRFQEEEIERLKGECLEYASKAVILGKVVLELGRGDWRRKGIYTDEMRDVETTMLIRIRETMEKVTGLGWDQIESFIMNQGKPILSLEEWTIRRK